MKKIFIGLLLLVVTGLIALPAVADPLVWDPFITLNADPTACVEPGDTIVYSIHYEGTSHKIQWEPIELSWDPQFMDFEDYVPDWHMYVCQEQILKESEGVFQCRRADVYGYHQLTMKIKNTVPDNTNLKMHLFAKYGYPNADELSFDLEKMTVVKTNCNPVPEFPSAILPPTMIIGLLATVMLIQRTREF
ncbi:MAG: hypothetical protein EHM53_10490 [Methanoregulaceae archaeon]|nr:MAG: hypothetical protein EHM53_10490 [Methanoregulaceae archaeon]